MASKSKGQSQQIKMDSKREFLESSQVNNWIKNALSQLVANRPDDPIAFLDQFFGNLGENTNKMNQALELISISHHSNHGFSQNATSAYEVLSQPKSARHPAGVLGGTYKTFLDHICSSMPVEVREQLFKKIAPRDFEFIPVDVFQSGLLACLILGDYLSISESLYKVLDSSNDNTVEKQVCEAVITELEEILNLSSHLDPTSYVNVGRKLQPDYLALALEDANISSKSSQKLSLSCEDFLKLIAQLFIQKVKPLR
ncbi:tubulin polyglutamylase complex subunit 1-like [Apostichopus japonicus]|uniref:tubulin polyglutamylase complex subunit 1-like n=1 Tax=Stichopus japonicus TaxID=307972 RepID=UPI003AB73D8F